ncbi:ATP-binding protein [Pseudonocardia alaniniphila]|uniref:AAA family ATPase n=1 Tax=Pseudonocardia alaniniphila TaxID=75291 RepID=A0ABS9T7X3_9PSEU|nr:AAA family ATPase [Pseudonocardia alaniniphila]MCH6164639.1 AAA family ATPase [Pseudonocardia alaniniphila]
MVASHGEVPLRGRAAELADVRESLEAVRSEGGSILVVRGAAGAGRSRLLAEARRMADAMGIRSLSGAADPHSRAVPLAPIMEALLNGPDPVLEPDALPAALFTSADHRFLLLQTMRQQLEQASLQVPLLLTFDDLQWADAATLLAMRSLPRRLAQRPLVWMVAVRDGVMTDALRTTLDQLAAAGAHTITLKPLETSSVEAITHDVLGDDVDESVRRLAERAADRPLLLVELLRGVAEHTAGPTGDGHDSLGGLPERFRDLVARTVERLPDRVRRTVQIAAVVGPRFTVRQLEALLDEPASALLEPLRSAIAEDLIVAHADHFTFRHDLVREAIVANLPADLVRGLRRQVVDADLRAGRPLPEAATLLAAVALPGDAEAVSLLREAALMVAPSDPAAAADLSVRALELTSPRAADWADLVTETIQLLLAAGRAGPAAALAEQSLEVPLGPEAEARVRLGGALVGLQFAFVDAVRHCRTALELRNLSPSLRADLLAVLALATALDGDPEAAGEFIAPAMSAARACDNTRAEAVTVCVGSIVDLHRGDWRTALAGADAAVDLSKRVEVAHRLCDPEIWRAMALAGVGRLDDALAVTETQQRQAGVGAGLAETRLWSATRSRLLLEAGRPAEARAAAEEALAMVDEIGHGDFAAVTAICALGRVAVLTGDEEALATAERNAHVMQASKSTSVRNAGAWLAALVAASDGDPGRAIASLTDGSARYSDAGPWRCHPLDVAEVPWFVRVALQAGQHDFAERAAAAAERRSEANPDMPLFCAIDAHARGLLLRDHEELARAASLYEAAGRPLARAAALEDAGNAATRHDRAEAVRLLETAMRIADEAGAQRDAARVRSALRELGVYRRRSTRPCTGQGWQALTPSELEVVRLIARGATNRAAAERLYVSPHTVSTHLKHAFTKLGVTSRLELARIALTRAQSNVVP